MSDRETESDLKDKRFDFEDEDTGAQSEAYLAYLERPKPFYYLAAIDVEEGHRKKGYGRRMLQEVNDFLDTKKIIGLLWADDESESNLSKFYENNGWKKVSGHARWYIYGPRDEFSEEETAEAIREARRYANL